MPSTAMPSASLASMSADPGQLAGELSGPLADGVGEEQLAAGRRPQAVLGDLEAALVGHLEPADLLDRVTPELDPDRVLLGRREDVEDPAADGELAAALDEVGPRVGGRGESVDDVLERRLVSRLAARPAPARPARGPPAAGRPAPARRRRTAARMRGRSGPDGVRRRSTARRRPTVSLRGLSRSCGRVSQLGKVATRSGGSRQPSASARSSASRVVAVTSRIGRDGRSALGARAVLLVGETGHDERPGSTAHRDVDEGEPVPRGLPDAVHRRAVGPDRDRRRGQGRPLTGRSQRSSVPRGSGSLPRLPDRAGQHDDPAFSRRRAASHQPTTGADRTMRGPSVDLEGMRADNLSEPFPLT